MRKIEDYTNTQGEADRHIVDATNSDVWARFIQIGGESGQKIYNKFFQKLQKYIIITLYCVTPDGIQTVNTYNASTSSTVKRIKNGVVVIEKDGKTYNAAGKQL